MAEAFTEIVDGSLMLYEFADGHATAADDGEWVSARFESVEAARSWVGHFDEAELEFRRINNGRYGPELVQIRV